MTGPLNPALPIETKGIEALGVASDDAGPAVATQPEPAAQSQPEALVPNAFLAELVEQAATIARKAADELYGDLMHSVQEYLCQNVEFNIQSKFEAQRREYLTALKAIGVIETANDLREAKDNAYAVLKGYWSEERAEEYRARAAARASLSQVHG